MISTLTLGTRVQPHHHSLNLVSGTEVLGSCNGLIALCNYVQELDLFNPSTRKLKTLPLPLCLVGFPSVFIFYGFGQNKINDDYKLVRVVHFKGNDGDDVEVEVYSLKINSWKELVTFLDFFVISTITFIILCLGKVMVCLLVLLYIGYLLRATCGLSLWLLIWRLRSFVNRRCLTLLTLAMRMFMWMWEVWRDVCVFHYYNLVYVDMWMMKEHAVKESWTKLFSVEEPTPRRTFSFLRPSDYSRTGDKLLLEVRREKLVWFDLEKSSLRSVKIDGHGLDFVDTEICVASLVPLNDAGGSGINGMKQRNLEEKEKRHKKKRDDFLSIGFKLVL